MAADMSTSAAAGSHPDPDHEPGRRWERRPVLDPVLVGVVAFLVYAAHGYHGGLNHDLGVFTYGGEQVAKGVVPYVTVFNSVGPLADAVPGAAIWLGHLFGVDPILAARVSFTVLSAIACALLSVLARDTFGSRRAAFVAPAVFLLFEEFLTLASDGPREKTTMVVLLIATLILVGRRRWLAAGVCTALATLTWQPVLAVALTAVAGGLLLERTGRVRAATRFVAGGLIPSVVTLGVFAVAGATRTAIDGFITVNLLYTKQPSALSAPGHTWHVLWSSYHLSLILLVLGLAASLVLTVVSIPGVLPSVVEPSPEARLLVVTGLAGAVATVWTVSVVNGGPDLFVLLPFAALGLTGSVVRLSRALPDRAGELLTAGIVVAGVALAVVTARVTTSDLLRQQRADVAAVLRTQPADATVMSLDAPQVLALARRTNPTSYQLFNGNMIRYLDHDYPGGLRGYRHLIARTRPTFIVVGGQSRGAHWTEGFLARDYWRIGNGASWSWYLSRAAGPAARDRAHAANQRVMGHAGRRLAPADQVGQGASS